MTRTGRLRVVLVLNLFLVGALVAVGLSAHSLGVLAEGVDYLADAAAIAVSLLAIWLSNRPPTIKHPHGYPKATLLAAAVNALWLLVLSLLVAAGATSRLVTGTHEVHGLPVLIVSGIAAIVMVVGALILGSDVDDLDDDNDNDNDSLNMRAVFLDTAADAAAAAGVAVAGGIILATGACSGLTPPSPSSSPSSWAITQCDCSLSLRQPDAHPLRSPWARTRCVFSGTITAAV